VDGEPGSPLIMLHALLSHVVLPRVAAVRFIFLFIERDRRRIAHLQGEIQEIALPANVEVHIEHGAFEETFRELVESIKGADKTLIPSFAFIDPFGYSTSSMSLAGKFLDFPRSEALFFLPLSFVHRFVGRQGQEDALTNLFNTDRWRDAVSLEGDARREFLLHLFEDQLRRQGQVAFVTSFELRTRDGNDYRLVFATGHQRGLELMKRAMWSVDPLQGTRYLARTETGQEVLFQPTVDTGPLLAELQSVFGRNAFTVPDASRVTLLRTPYLPDGHLKRLTLVPAEKRGVLHVTRPQVRRAGSFTDDVVMRFV
jgi:three-Cys-motif partner protein